LRARRTEILAALGQRDLSPRLFFQDSGEPIPLPDSSIQLVVTSPPYPYIERWDRSFESSLGLAPGTLARDPDQLERIHEHLGRTWRECYRLLQPGGILAVNIGDATRTVGGEFRLFPNHAHVIRTCERLGFRSLVPVLWKKPTNRPDSFLGSGFAPPNAYVTLDCEHILIFRKGGRRILPSHDPLRAASQFSKAERDRWFSQVWTVRGAPQSNGRASFPEEIPYRLIRMHSLVGDTVLDPFAGSGATLHVASTWGRRPVGVERDPTLREELLRVVPSRSVGAEQVLERLVRFYPVSGA
jgi:modification methylase